VKIGDAMDLQILNDRQRAAVEKVKGPLLVLAGAGSGKTRVLTYRIAYLIDEMGVLPSDILALTFTNKAAKEMRDRVGRLVGTVAYGMWMGTFHSICVRILRQYAAELGYTTDFVIYDTQDQKTLIKEVMKELNISDKDLKIATVRATISEAKNEWVDPKRFTDLHNKDYTMKLIGKIYGVYQERMKKYNAMDFDDLLIQTLELFKKKPEILIHYQRRFKFIHVDEYQDTNSVQYKLIRQLADYHHNVCVVGDNDQSIYGWRGADIRNIQDFEKDFPGAEVVMLEQNYRSSSTILEVANHVIQNNRNRKDKRLWTENPSGEKIHYYRAKDEYDEARYVANTIIKATDLGVSYSDFAVLYRTNAQSRNFEEAFIRASIPYKIIGGLKFYERMEVKDIMAYLKVIANPQDEVSLRRIINTPRRGIGDKTIDQLMHLAMQDNLSIFEAVEVAIETKSFAKRTHTGLAEFYSSVAPFIQRIDHMKPSEIMKGVLEVTGYLADLEQENTIESKGRIENIEELLSQIMNFELSSETPTLSQYLQDVSLLSDQDEIEENESGHVLLMTIHAAKGLEFPIVFLVGMEETLFPSQMTMETDEGIEEERRLCYVGVTRAEKVLHLSHAYMRTRFGKLNVNDVSRFIKEMPHDLLVSMEGQRPSFEERKPLQIGPSYKIIEPSKPVTEELHQDLKAGVKVRHKLFGDGMVITTKGEGDAMELTIAFDKKGIKRLVLGYAPLEIIQS